MRHRSSPVFVAAALAVLSTPVARAQTTTEVYVALGDSLTAGVVSGSLVETHQANSYPALIARAAGIQSFQQPTVSEPGIPPELTLVSLSPGPLVTPKASQPGSPTNASLSRSYNNLAVPSADSLDILSTATDGGGFHDLVLRGRGTALQQAASLRPTLVTLWIGNNDVLGAALAGRVIEGTTLTPVAKFRARFEETVATVKEIGARVVAANIPDVTRIPFVTTTPPVVVDSVTREPVLVDGLPVPLIGPTGSLASNAHVLLTASSLLAQGIGIPKTLGGQGTALPDAVILDADEVGAIRDHVVGYNLAIRDVCNTAGIPVLDVNALLESIAVEGRNVGGVKLTTEYLTGGIFSYDGVHLTEMGYAILANEWIREINAAGGSLPLVDLGPFLGVGGTRRPAGHVEFSEEAYRSLLAVFPPLK